MSRSRKKYPVSWVICIRHPSLKMEKRWNNRFNRRRSKSKIKHYIRYEDDNSLQDVNIDKILDFYWFRRFDGKFRPFLHCYHKSFKEEYLNKLKRK